MTPFREWRWTHWVLIIGIFFILLLAGLLVYVLLQPETFTPAPPTPEEEEPVTGLPPTQEGPPELPPSPVEDIPSSLIQGRDTQAPVDLTARGDVTSVNTLTETPVDHVNLSPSGNGLSYYDPNTNRFQRINQNGTIQEVSDAVFADVENVTYAPNAQESVVEFPDGSNVLYNFDNDEQVTLPSHWQDFDFSPDSENIGFKSVGLNPEQNYLAVSSKDGNSARQITFLGENDETLDVDWSPNNQVIGTYTQQDGLTDSELFFVGFNDENFPFSQIHGLNFEGKWTPSGKNLLYSASHQDDGFRPRLWLADGSGSNVGQNRRSIDLNTWAEKCTFADEQTAYCGVPTELPEGSGIIPAVTDGIEDDLYRVDLENGGTSRIAIPETSLNVNDIQVSENGRSLFIHDKFTRQVKQIYLE